LGDSVESRVAVDSFDFMRSKKSPAPRRRARGGVALTINGAGLRQPKIDRFFIFSLSFRPISVPDLYLLDC
jgi:hypothetical protein